MFLFSFLVNFAIVYLITEFDHPFHSHIQITVIMQFGIKHVSHPVLLTE